MTRGDDRLVEVVAEDPRWAAVDLAGVSARAATAALAACGRDPGRHEIALLAADDVRVAQLNAGFRGRPRPTNVLSWPAEPVPVPEPEGGEPLFLGDIALAFETCAGEAAAAGVALDDHVAHLVVHAVLHLLGFDHAEDAEAERMEALETKILASLGLADPYSGEVRP